MAFFVKAPLFTPRPGTLPGVVRAAVTGDGDDTRPIVLTATPNRLEVRACDTGPGAAMAEFAATVEGPTPRIVLSAILLVGILDVVRGPRVEISWDYPTHPVSLRDPEQADLATVWVLMPMAATANTENAA